MASKSQKTSCAALRLPSISALQNFQFIFIPAWDSLCKAGGFCLLGPCSCIPPFERSGASVGKASSLSSAWFVHF